MKQPRGEKVSATNEKGSAEQGVDSQPSGGTLKEATSGSEGYSDGEKEGESEKDLNGKNLTAKGPWGSSGKWDAIIQDAEEE